MKNHIWLTLPVMLLPGCIGLPEEPKGLPRSALLHENLPGILVPDSQRLNRCDKETTQAKQSSYCRLVYKAMAGDSAAALQLAEVQGNKAAPEEKLYWYNVAAENDDATAMYKLGSA